MGIFHCEVRWDRKIYITEKEKNSGETVINIAK